MKSLIIAISMLLLPLGNCLAHNCLFFPGDAFFSSKFTAEFDAKTEGGLVLKYERFVGNTFLCGYAGYESLAVNEISPKVAANLSKVHELVFPAAAELPLFVYNREFPLSSPIGLKYNEHWHDVQVAEAGLPQAIYDQLGGAEFVIDDWASAGDIAPLAIADGRAPMVRAKGETGVVEQPLSIDAAKVMFVILLGGDGKVARFARREEGLIFFVVTETLRRYRFDRKGVAMPQEIDAPVDEVVAQRRKISQDHAALRSVVRVYEMNFGKAPTKEQGIAALSEKPEKSAPLGWMPLLKKLPTDPWGRSYRWDGDVFFSLGADGFESTDDVVEPYRWNDDGEVIPQAEPGG